MASLAALDPGLNVAKADLVSGQSQHQSSWEDRKPKGLGHISPTNLKEVVLEARHLEDLKGKEGGPILKLVAWKQLSTHCLLPGTPPAVPAILMSFT